MKIWCLAFFFLSGCGQVNSEPRILVLEDSTNLGLMNAYTLHEVLIPIWNRGGAEARISDWKGECRCINVGIESSYVSPGESTNLRMSIDPKGRYGAQKEDIAVYYNSEGESPYIFSIKYEIYNAIVAEPEYVLIKAPPNSTGDSTIIHLLRQDGEGLNINAIQAPDYLDFRILEEKMGESVVEFVLNEPLDSGVHESVIKLSIEGVDEKLTSLRSYVQIENVYDISPRSLFLHNLKRVDSGAQTLSIRRRDGKEFIIRSVASNGANLRIEFDREKKSEHEILVSLIAPEGDLINDVISIYVGEEGTLVSVPIGATFGA